MYARGQQATAHAEAAYDAAVSAYNSQAAAYNAAMQAGKNPGTRPVEPGPFVDPGAADRAEAQAVLASARARRDAAADQAESTLTRATGLAPATPSLWSQLGDDLSDAWNIDRLIGTPSELIGPDGDLAGHQQHTLWGTTIWATGGASTPLRFPGQYLDPETGLHYNYHRYYDPTTGAYLTPDPLGLAPSPNPHAYVPNPTVLTDPLGLAPCPGVPASEAGTGADNVVNGVRLAQQLTREEAASVFTQGGELKPEVIAQSREIINGTQLGNKQLVSELTSNGSDIADWGKYTTPTFRSPAGAFQVHFYYNPIINKVFYGQDYKVVFVGGSP
jgi:RHS repeat-associated protein